MIFIALAVLPLTLLWTPMSVAAPKVKGLTWCEHLLTAKSGELTPNSALHMNAFLMLTHAFDQTESEKIIQVAPGLTTDALRLFMLEGLQQTELQQLRMKTSFDDSDPEIELYLKGATEIQNVLLRLLPMRRQVLHYWRPAGTDNFSTEMLAGKAWGFLPRDAQVGFVLKAVADVPDIYVTTSLNKKNQVTIQLGLLVDCAELSTYTTQPHSTEKVLTATGITCRLPVLSTR